MNASFFVLNVDWVFVRNWVLLYINENAKRSDASILMLYIHFTLPFPVTFGASQTDYCCGATVGSEQQHNQDLKEIYKVGRILEFITFYHNVLLLTTFFGGGVFVRN